MYTVRGGRIVVAPVAVPQPPLRFSGKSSDKPPRGIGVGSSRNHASAPRAYSLIVSALYRDARTSWPTGASRVSPSCH
jgi:hypothetical protein